MDFCCIFYFMTNELPDKYDHKDIEKKWQEKWQKDNLYKTREENDKPKSYVLDMFPYPSGEGLHVGHPKGYIATDIYSRMKKMMGFNVLHPMGWDAFGLPAENFAIKNKVHPRVAVEKNINRFKEQLAKIGFNYDWEREINTTDPEYYKWTQWIFLKMFEKGLAHESYEPINWCPSCQTGLANEDVEVDGTCERCGSVVEKRPMRQWVLKITEYADRMLEDLRLLDWPEYIKESQRNWIGKSEGVEIDFRLVLKNIKPRFVILHGYTGHANTNFLPWFKKELEKLGHEVETPELPNTDNPTEEEQVEYVLKNCKLDENTVVVGHSLGSVVACKALMKLNKNISSLVLIASAIDPEFDKSDKSDSRPFWNNFTWNFDYEQIKKLTGGRIAVLSDTLESERAPYLKHLASKLDAALIETKAEEEHFCAKEEPAILKAVTPLVKVFTTRADTLFGATCIVLAPEHEWVGEVLARVENKSEVEKYINESKDKTEIERGDAKKEKTGVELKGIKAVNPATGEEIPVFVADYVLGNYGTGAVMAVPAHDERDFEFAKKYNLAVKEVVIPRMPDHTNPHREGKDIIFRNAIIAVLKNPKTEKYLTLKWKKQPWTTFVMGGIEGDEDPVDAAIREIKEETGYKNFKFVKSLGSAQSEFFAAHKDVNRIAHTRSLLFELIDESREEISDEEKDIHELEWQDLETIKKNNLTHSERDLIFGGIVGTRGAFVEEGIVFNSGEFTRLTTSEAREKIAEKFGKKVTKYKLKDWVFSRQRYWGEPIPVVHCVKDGVVGVPEKDLPVKLPEVENYQPTGTGESPLAGIPEWINTTCPKCGGPAKRETNTMPQWAGSSWYYLRFMDPQNKSNLVDPKKEKYWAPVDVYVGGDHAVRHLIYARFWHKFLFDIGVVSTAEPFARLEFLGFILAKDGKKMSKRWGNVINPDDIVETWGADTLRLYEMFMGPFENTIAWNDDNLIGVRRFIERVWRFAEKVRDEDVEEIENTLHQTIKKVSEDIESFKFNTSISQFMIFLNSAEKSGGIGKSQFETFLKLLAPFAPHLCEELWKSLGHEKSIHLELWPKYDEAKLVDSRVTIVVQVNGKVRAQFEAEAGITEAEAVSQAKELPEMKKWLSGVEVKKVIFVPKKLVNFVVV